MDSEVLLVPRGLMQADKSATVSTDVAAVTQSRCTFFLSTLGALHFNQKNHDNTGVTREYREQRVTSLKL